VTDTIQVEGLTVTFRSKGSEGGPLWRKSAWIRAVDDASFDIGEEESFGLTGETGSGKSTIAKAILGLVRPASGKVRLLGREVSYRRRDDVAFVRDNVGIVFQDPVKSLNPRLAVKEIISEALVAKAVPRSQFDEKIGFIMRLVGLNEGLLRAYPRELSGGQRQRVSLARALVVPKKLLILDEPTSALDVSIQAQVLNTLKRLKSELGLSLLFITHDINVIKYMCSMMGVLFYGKMMEVGTTREVISTPRHPYAMNLISNVLTLTGKGGRSEADTSRTPFTEHHPSPTGCRYRDICSFAFEKCAIEPLMVSVSDDHLVRCFLYEGKEKVRVPA
jgi:peptide/nickel transport system ATP-binding protein